MAVIVIDNPPVNAMSRAVRAGLAEALAVAAADMDVKGIVITGAGKCFVAGADLSEMNQPPAPPLLSEVVEAIDAIEKPVIAAINGAALGGGLEIALACDLRLAEARAQLGLPETRLGIVPGAGGTQRLPRLVGTARAAEMITSARIVRAAEALALGLIDRIATDELLSEAIAAAPSTPKRRVSALNPPVEDEQVHEKLMSAAQGKARTSPAIAEAIALVEQAGNATFEVGLADERRAFFSLRDSVEAKALRHLFFAERSAGKVPGLEGIAPRKVERVGVIGAGTMGKGIAASIADAGIAVDLVERDAVASEAGKAGLRDLYQRQVTGGRLSEAQAAERLGRITSTADWSALTESDLVIEAAFENLSVKTDIFRRLDKVAKPGAILASNTSYLDLDAIAAATGRPQHVVGLHFFAPANIMRLLEVVRGQSTAADVLATAIAFATRLGKQPVVASNAHGFIGNRIFATYRRHAEYLMEDGASPYAIDAALVAYGFAMGVFATSDLSGLDISYAMRRSLDATRDPQERYVKIADRLVESGRLGRKSKAGYYAYSNGTPEHDPETERIVAAERGAKGITPRTFGPEQIQRRIIAVMANEGAALLEQAIALRASDIDLVLVNGYGFPRSKGGPMWAADQTGLPAIVEEIETAASENPGSITLSNMLRQRARQGGKLSE